MIWYLVAFLAATAVDSVPVFAPPAWTVLVFLLVKFHLKPWPVIVFGVAGTTIGRLVLTTYVRWIGGRILSGKEEKNLEFLGSRLARSRKSAFLFVLGYSLTPLSTTALFSAAGLAKVRPIAILPPFSVGKLISYSAVILSGKYVADNFHDLIHGALSFKGLALAVTGLLVLLGFLFIDWRQLLAKKKLRFNFKIWK